ncbi:uncharacterized protein EV420DRAFT_790460 [Desarmillaria tabescens]|uniref:F-box domain-containing protein n=1 Tax=Armillaria tabescens TaxID=1929756 RepID=A0AA39JUM2_ARMTA|nr:uncharacterized protein EV420DRAFT_790460 [Desarmillaria tabescens]KAK0449069.1 hypothetical protein EV420DRAFT_790460 [Desarmillaria tabescens]
MLSVCPTCGFLDLCDQKSDRNHDFLNIVPNYPVPLSSADRQWLHADIIDLENDIAILEHQIQRLGASLSSLRQARKRKESQIESRKSRMAPVWSLPAEIIAEIITLTASDDNSDSLDTRHSMPWVLSHVCHLWRNVALSTSAPWSRLYIDDTRGRDYPFAPELLQTYLDRSKEIPLSVTINSSNNIDDIRERLTPHQSRLHTLELNLCLPGLKALSVLVANFPKLTILRLSVEGTNIGPCAPCRRVSSCTPLEGRVSRRNWDISRWGAVEAVDEVHWRHFSRRRLFCSSKTV